MALVLVAVLILWRLVHSPFGKVLEAIRESEERAKACGYNTTMVKQLSFLKRKAGLYLPSPRIPVNLRYRRNPSR
jgi:ABC-type uncharacterized transport system permease subunit